MATSGSSISARASTSPNAAVGASAERQVPERVVGAKDVEAVGLGHHRLVANGRQQRDSDQRAEGNGVLHAQKSRTTGPFQKLVTQAGKGGLFIPGTTASAIWQKV
jgi:hypothetical protein